MFYSYAHVKRLGTEEVEGYLNGTVYLTWKIDGTNSSVWMDEDGRFHFGSRKREITLDKDNGGFMAYMLSGGADGEGAAAMDFCREHPGTRLYGEFLGEPGKKRLGHIKDYERAGFFAFDVRDLSAIIPSEKGNEGYMSPSTVQYQRAVELLGDRFLVPAEKLTDPSEGEVEEYLDKNHFDLPQGSLGEGIVLKNYDYLSQWGNHEFAKIVRAEFRERKGKGAISDGADSIERQIAEEFVTSADVEKCAAKIETMGVPERGRIPATLSLVYKDLLEEEMVEVTKRFKNPTVNFRDLQREVYNIARRELGV